jgi:tetratricopeptide (TPR) repeat protein
MKKIASLLCIFLIIQNASAQVDSIDALLRTIISEKNNVNRIENLNNYFLSIQENDPLKGLVMAQHLLVLAQKLKDKHVEAFANSQLGNQNHILGNSTKSLEYALKALKITEQLNNVELSSIVKNRIGLNYNLQPARQIVYYREAYDEALKAGDYNLMAMTAGNIGRTFDKKNELDSALFYLHIAEQANIKKHIKYGINAWNYFSLGTIYAKMKNHTLALAYYNSGIDDAKKSGAATIINRSYNFIAQFYFNANQTDSAMAYAYKAIEAVKNTPFSHLVLNPSKLLTNIYRNKNSDSAIKYADMYVTANEKINSSKTIQENYLMLFEEQLRQKAHSDEKLKKEEQRHQNVQYGSIAIGIIVFIIVFLLLSRTIVVNERFISFFAILGFLVFFEFVNLLIHSWLADFTHESPLLMLFALVFIAAFLIEFRHRMEPIVKEKLVKKNKAIRLAAAKKTIQKLEEKSGV